MVSKDAVRDVVSDALGDALKPIGDELLSIRRDVDRLAQNVENIVGYRVEIDHALQRIGATERHLQIKKNMAA
jgi:hypothetical protein